MLRPGTRIALLVTALLVAMRVPLRGAGQIKQAKALFELYDGGHYGEVVADLASRAGHVREDRRREPGPIAAFLGDITRAAPDWIAAGDPSQRRLVVATLALEAVHLMPGTFAPDSVVDEELDDRYRLLEWAETLILQNQSPPPGERWWWMSALASIQGQRDLSRYLAYGEALLHAAEARFPAERRFTLEEGLLDDEEILPGLISFPGTLSGLSAPAPTLAVIEDAAGHADVSVIGAAIFPTNPSDKRVQIRNAVRAFSSVLDDPVNGPEAQLHLGSIELRIDERTFAVKHLEQAAATLSEPAARYEAYVLLSCAHARLLEFAPAEEAIRRAIAIIPGTDSAARVLAWIQASTGRQADAAQLMGRQLQAPAVPDPMLHYERGEAVHWADFIRHLREELHP